MRIALFRPHGIGALLRAVPAIRALDAAYPDAHITLIGTARMRELASRLQRYLDAFAEFPGFPGMGGECRLDAVPDFFERMKATRFDLAVQMHGSGEIANPLMVLMGARHNAGFHRPGRYCPDAERFLEWNDREGDVARWLRLATHLGAAPKGNFLEFPLLPDDWAEWRALRLERYVCLHSERPSRPLAELADALAMEGWNVVVSGDTTVAAEMRQPAFKLATTLGGTAAVIAKARLVISSDEDATVIAAAMRTPCLRLRGEPPPPQVLREARQLLAA
jgi:ADP-heptose:LPS heptosyltransferase